MAENEWHDRDVYNLLVMIGRGYTPKQAEIEMLETRQNLDLRSSLITKLPASIGRLTALTYLDLAYTRITKLPKSIGNLTALTSLDLTGTKITQLPESIGNLTSLTSLKLSNTLITELPGAIGCMTALTCLDISRTRINELPEWICGLSELTSLNLSRTQITELPKPIGKLTSLTSLDLNDTRISKLPESIGGLTALTSLDLRTTQIAELPMSIGGLTALTYLGLAGTRITKLPEWIGRLNALASLDLRSTQITELPGWIGGLNALTTLELSNTLMDELPKSICGLTALTRLKLSHTLITELPEWIGTIPKLQMLDINGLTLGRIPKSLALKGLPFVDEDPSDFYRLTCGINLHGVTLINQDISIFLNNPELIPSLYNEEQVVVSECKVLFLGDGGSGKSYTIRRIEGEGAEETDENPYLTKETPGVEISDYHVNDSEGDFVIHFWDFGGHEILHSIHRCFLTDNTCYVVMVNTRTANPDTQARFWLRNVKTFAPNSPVLLFINLWEDYDSLRAIDETRLRKDYPNVNRIIYCSAKKASQKEFREKVMNNIIGMAEEYSDEMRTIPASFDSVRREIIRESKTKDVVDKARYLEICEASGVTDAEAPALLTYLNRLGVCFSYHLNAAGEELKEYKLLKPIWLTNAIYAIIKEGAANAAEGKIPIASVRQMLVNPAPEMVEGKQYSRTEPSIRYKGNEPDYVLAVAEAYSICSRVDENLMFFPALCPTDSPKEALEEPEGFPSHAEYRFKYDYLPDAVVHKLMIRFLKKDLNVQHCWHDGMIVGCWDEHRIVIRKVDDDRTLRIVFCSKKGASVCEVFPFIREEILSINDTLGLKANEIIVEDKNEFTLLMLIRCINNQMHSIVGSSSGDIYDPSSIINSFFDAITVSGMTTGDDGNVIIAHRFLKYSRSNKKLRQAIYDVYDHRCFYCKRIKDFDDIEIDCILPHRQFGEKNDKLAFYLSELRSRGFDTDKPDYIENYLPSCRNCNRKKGSKLLDVETLREYHSIAVKNTPKVLELMQTEDSRSSDSAEEKKLSEFRQDPWGVFKQQNKEPDRAFGLLCESYLKKSLDGQSIARLDAIKPGEENGADAIYKCISTEDDSFIDYVAEFKHVADDLLSKVPDFKGSLYLFCNRELPTYKPEYVDLMNEYAEKGVGLVVISGRQLICEILEHKGLIDNYIPEYNEVVKIAAKDFKIDTYEKYFEQILSANASRSMEFQSTLDFLNALKLRGMNKYLSENRKFLFASDEQKNLIPANERELQDLLYKMFLLDSGFVQKEPVKKDEEKKDIKSKKQVQKTEKVDADNKDTDDKLDGKDPSPADLEIATKLVLEEFDKWLVNKANNDKVRYKIVGPPERQDSGTQFGYDCGLALNANEERYRLRFECKCYIKNKRHSRKDAVKDLKLPAYAYSLLNHYMDYTDDRFNYRWILVCPFGKLQNGVREKLFEGWNDHHTHTKLFVVAETATEIKCKEFLSVSEKAYQMIYGTTCECKDETRNKVFEWLLDTVIGTDEVQASIDAKLLEVDKTFGDTDFTKEDYLVTKTSDNKDALKQVMTSLCDEKGTSQHYGVYVIGEYGTGKTWLLYKTVYEIIEHPGRYAFEPFYIKLQDVYSAVVKVDERKCNKQIADFLSEKRITSKSPAFTNTRKTPVILLDGLDEVWTGLSHTDQKVDLLFEVITQIRRMNSNALFVVSSRESDYAACDKNAIFKNEGEKFTKVYLGEFSTSQVSAGLQQMKQKENADIEHLDKLAKDVRFIRLMQHPVYYGFLPTIAERGISARNSNESFDETHILDQIIEKGMDELSEVGGEMSKDILCKYAICKTMDPEYEIEFDYSEKTPDAKDPLTKLRNLPAGIFRILKEGRDCCCLEFKHNVIREYLVAYALHGFIHKCIHNNAAYAQSKKGFLETMEKTPMSTVIRKFFLEMLNETSGKAVELLLSWIQETANKQNKALSTKLLEILLSPERTLCGTQENPIDLSGIAAGNLYLWNCKLQHVDMRKAQIDNLQLTNAELSDIDMRGARFSNLQLYSEVPIIGFAHLRGMSSHKLLVSTENGNLIEYTISDLFDPGKITVEISQGGSSYAGMKMFCMDSSCYFISGNSIVDKDLLELFSFNSYGRPRLFLKSGDRLCCVFERESQWHVVCFDEGRHKIIPIGYPDIENLCLVGKDILAYVSGGRLLFSMNYGESERDFGLELSENISICSDSNGILYIADSGKLKAIKVTAESDDVIKEYDIDGVSNYKHLLYLDEGVFAASDEKTMYLLNVQDTKCTVRELSGGVICRNLNLGDGDCRVRDDAAYSVLKSMTLQ